MNLEFKIDGIYDSRTFVNLLSQDLNYFSFDFRPRSFSFIQEQVFLNEFLIKFKPDHKIFLKFPVSNDPMIFKIINELSSRKFNLKNIFFEFDYLFESFDPKFFPYNFIVNFFNNVNFSNYDLVNFSGLTFDTNGMNFLEDNESLKSFASNFYIRFNKYLSANFLMIYNIDWDILPKQSLLDILDFNILSLPINSTFEICYRNVNLPKLSSGIDLIKKSYSFSL